MHLQDFHIMIGVVYHAHMPLHTHTVFHRPIHEIVVFTCEIAVHLHESLQ